MITHILNMIQTHVAEVYSPPRVAANAHKFGLIPGTSVDITVNDENGQPWDLTQKRDRSWALKRLREQKRRWVRAAPPCTAFAVLDWMLHYPRMSKAQVDAKVADGPCTPDVLV